MFSSAGSAAALVHRLLLLLFRVRFITVFARGRCWLGGEVSFKINTKALLSKIEKPSTI
jgi:hypothetical protein